MVLETIVEQDLITTNLNRDITTKTITEDSEMSLRQDLMADGLHQAMAEASEAAVLPVEAVASEVEAAEAAVSVVADKINLNIF